LLTVVPGEGLLQSFVHLLTFELDVQRFGLPLADVQEVVRVAAFARLPSAPQVIEGVLNFRGSAVPVLDIRARFGLPTRPVRTSDHLVVARAGARLVAIRVDRVADLIEVAAGDIEDIATVTPHSGYVSGVLKLPGDLVLLHDLSTFLSTAEAAGLDRSLEVAVP
jgi:purine-binding chemotaxis protein CheW